MRCVDDVRDPVMAACRCQRIGETTKGPKRAQGRNNRKKKQPTATARGNNEPDVGGRRGGAARPGGMEKLNTTRNMGGSKMETQQNGENGKSASVANAACWPAREERSTTWTQTAKDRDSPRTTIQQALNVSLQPARREQSRSMGDRHCSMPEARLCPRQSAGHVGAAPPPTGRR